MGSNKDRSESTDRVGFTTTLNSGRYVGRKIGWVIMKDPKYVRDMVRLQEDKSVFSRDLIECVKGLDFCGACWVEA